MLTADDCLDNEVEDARPKKVHVDSYLLQVLAEGAQGPLVAEIVLLTILVGNELFVLLVD
jgi:hypothetical protein